MGQSDVAPRFGVGPNTTTLALALANMKRLPVFAWLLGCICLGNLHSYAKEIEATNEWQALGENDTIAAGMHVRMDLSTGEKWVKVATDESTDPHSTSSLAVTAHGTIDAEPDYDFEMMYRILSQLPDDEKQRIGLPEEPENRNDEQFRQQMREIWALRQTELKKWEEQHQADLPKLLKERIHTLKEFLTDSSKSSVDFIQEVLADLEYHLCDIDMARDFHTLGGWPVLAQYLDPDLATIANVTDLDALNSIYAHTAWALGSAVKNTGEFTPFAVEAIPWRRGSKTTVVELLMEHVAHDSLSKMQKILYGLGAMLRGNRAAQLKWQQGHGPETLAKRVQVWLGQGDTHSIKLCKRALLLLDDLIAEEEGIFTAAELATSEWCDTVLNAVVKPDLYEVSVHAMISMAEFCHGNHWDALTVSTRLSSAAEIQMENEDLDSSTLKDHLRLMDQVHEIIGLK